jgi:predicted dehydrogenase
MPVSVRAITKEGANRKINVENDVTAMFEYANGATGVFVTSTHDFPGTNRLEISGDGGKIVVDGRKASFVKLEIPESKFNAENTKFMPRIPSKTKKMRTSFLRMALGYVLGQHAIILNNFVDHILNGTPMIAPGKEGINGLTISNAIHLSGWLNREVTIPLDEDLYYAELQKKIVKEKEEQ